MRSLFALLLGCALLAGCGSDEAPPERRLRVVRADSGRSSRKPAKSGQRRRSAADSVDQGRVDRALARLSAEKRARAAAKARAAAEATETDDPDDPDAHDPATDDPYADDTEADEPKRRSSRRVPVKLGALNGFRVKALRVTQSRGRWVASCRIQNNTKFDWERAGFVVEFFDRQKQPLGEGMIIVKRPRKGGWISGQTSRGPDEDEEVWTAKLTYSDDISARVNLVTEVDLPVRLDRKMKGVRLVSRTIVRDNDVWTLTATFSTSSRAWKTLRVGVEFLNAGSGVLHRSVLDLDGLSRAKTRTVSVEGPEGSENVARIYLALDDAIAAKRR